VSEVIYRLIISDWAHQENPSLPRSLTGLFTKEELSQKNNQGYNCYYFLNIPSQYDNTGQDIHSSDINVFDFLCVDMDLKEGIHESKESFVSLINSFSLKPSAIIDSGNGIHVYWRVVDLDAMSYLRLQRRLIRKFKTDKAISKIYQLMRVPGTLNVKEKNNYKLCKSIENNDVSYTSEDFDKALPAISKEDEDYCINHYNMTYNQENTVTEVELEIPLKFQTLMNENTEAKRLFFGPVQDRSAANYRLGHLLKAKGFTKQEARAVLLNCDKAISRRGQHRFNYANNIVDKVWMYTEASNEEKPKVIMSESVRSLLSKSPEDVGYETRIYGHPMFDATAHGFRLGEVMGLIGGSGSGKSTLSLNFFKWFAERNPDYVHVFVTMEMPKMQLLKRWQKLAANNDTLHDMVYFLDQHDENGINRELTLNKIKDEILLLEKTIGKKVGCVVIDHIGCLSYEEGKTEYEKLMNACRLMKSFALETKSFLIMQSQSSREKAGPYGDVEIDKDAAYGTTKFENYCDYILTTWQPLSRVQHLSGILVNAFKYCKIRELDTVKDKIKMNQVYAMAFDKETETLRKIRKDELSPISYWNNQAASERSRDRKKAPSEIQDMDWIKDGETGSNKG